MSAGEIQLILAFIFLNPIQLLCLSAQNVSQIRDLMSYIAINFFLSDYDWKLSTPLLAVSLYVDPTAWMYIFGFSILTEDLLSAVFQLVFVVLGCGIMMFSTGNIDE